MNEVRSSRQYSLSLSSSSSAKRRKKLLFSAQTRKRAKHIYVKRNETKRKLTEMAMGTNEELFTATVVEDAALLLVGFVASRGVSFIYRRGEGGDRQSWMAR